LIALKKLRRLLKSSLTHRCPFTITANEQVLPMVGELKNLRLATEVHYLFQGLKIYSDVQKSSVRLNQS